MMLGVTQRDKGFCYTTLLCEFVVVPTASKMMPPINIFIQRIVSLCAIAESLLQMYVRDLILRFSRPNRTITPVNLHAARHPHLLDGLDVPDATY
jgi:hypothetical protein